MNFILHTKECLSQCRFRPYNVYGDGQIETGDYSTVIGVFETQYKNKEPLTITGDGEQRRDFTHIDDIVDGIKFFSKVILVDQWWN